MAKQAKQLGVSAVNAGESEKVLSVPLSRVFVPKDFNARTDLEATSKDAQGNLTTWDDFVRSMADGQHTPVFAHPEAPPGYDCTLIAGFKRCHALDVLGKKNGFDPKVKVILKDVNPLEALFLNLSENTAREELSWVDQANGIKRIQATAKAMGVTLSGTTIAAKMGKSQEYVAKLIKIVENVAPEVMAAAVKGTKTDGATAAKIGYQKMAAIVGSGKTPKTPDEQIKAYNDVATPTTHLTGADGMVERVLAAARKQGELFGRLAQMGAIKIVPETFFKTSLHLLVERWPEKMGRAGEPVPEKVLNSFFKAAEKAYQVGLTTKYQTKEEKAAAAAAKDVAAAAKVGGPPNAKKPVAGKGKSASAN